MPIWALIAALAIGVTFVVVTSPWSGSGGRHGASDAAPRSSSPIHTSSPAASTPTPELKGTLVIHGAGDVSLDTSYISTFASQGYGYAYAWSGLGGLFRRDDLTIVNVECPVTDRGSLLKEFSFHGTTAALPAMRDAGVDVGSLANNHAYDRGPDGVVDSRRNLAKAGIAPVGAGADQDEALRPAMFEIKGWRIAVLGFDEVLDPLDEVAGVNKPGTAAGHDFSLMVRAVKDADVDADIVIVMIHWGVELDTQPREYQISEGHRLIDAGADAIFGAHSHRLQPMSRYRGRPIFWSLGNFVWPNFSVSGSTTAVAQVTITPGGRFVGKLLPAFIAAPGHPVVR
jgi:poly-gamma-glutamate capsule biosynthesis protein CapA/YwtB (metallophosphatase superfamily)